MDPNTPDPQQQPQQSPKPQTAPMTQIPHQQLPQTHQAPPPPHYPAYHQPDYYQPPYRPASYINPQSFYGQQSMSPVWPYPMSSPAQTMPNIVPTQPIQLNRNNTPNNHTSSSDSQNKAGKTRKPATLKDPKTGQIIDIGKTDESSQNKSNNSDKVTTQSSTPTAATNTLSSTNTNSVEQQLLKKVSEETTVEQQLLKQVSEDKDKKAELPLSPEKPKQQQKSQPELQQPLKQPQSQIQPTQKSQVQIKEDKEDNKENEPAIVPEVKSEELTKVEEEQQQQEKDPKEGGKGDEIVSKEPVLHQGRRVYTIQFLKEIGDKMDLNDNSYQFNVGEHVDLFMPTYGHSRYSGRPMDQSYGGRSSGGQEKKKKIIATASLGQDVELKTTDNPWKPSVQAKEEKPVDEAESEAIKKKFRSILNKLTPNNFEKLASAVTELNINTESKLGDVIDLVFAKALSEPGYCVLYGQMCSHLKKITAGQANFGNTLLRRCQNQFQSDPYVGLNVTEREEKIEAETDEEVKKQLQEELYEDKFKCRMRSLGLIKFIGELYKIDMLNDPIMFGCILRLLSETNEESVECLCDLLVTIGEKLDNSVKSNNISADKDKKSHQQQRGGSATKAAYGQGRLLSKIVAGGNQNATSASPATPSSSNPSSASNNTTQQQSCNLDYVFDQMHKIRKNKENELPIRVRFKILDVCDLREKHHWHSKKTSAAPQKIEEIHQAHKEKLEQERKQNALGPRRSQEGRRGGMGHPSGSSNQLSSLGGEGRQGSGMHTSASSGVLTGSDSMRTNHIEMEQQKEFARNIDSLSKFLPSIQTNSSTRNQQSGPKPELRPSGSLRPASFNMMRNSVPKDTSSTTAPQTLSSSSNANNKSNASSTSTTSSQSPSSSTAPSAAKAT